MFNFKTCGMKYILLFVITAMITLVTLLVFAVIDSFGNVSYELLNKVMSIETLIMVVFGCLAILKVLKKI